MARRKLTPEEKAEKARLKEEALKKAHFERELNDLREMDIPEPAYLNKVGDRMFYGAWDYTEILEVLDGGKIYRCFSHVTRCTNRSPKDYEEKQHYEAWYNMTPYKELDEYPDRFEEEEDIRISYQQRELSSLLMMMFNRWGIDLEPEYQRGNVWTESQKQNLLDSIFKNIDIGKFTIIKRPWGDNPNKPLTPKLYEMLDGKQRLTAIYEFYIGKLKFKGHYFWELHPRDRNHFKHYAVSWAETVPLTKEQKYRYFLKLNTCGIPVAEDHIKKVREMWMEEKGKKCTSQS